MEKENKFVIGDDELNKKFSLLLDEFRMHVYESLIPKLSELQGEEKGNAIEEYKNQNPQVVKLMDDMANKVSSVVDMKKDQTVDYYVSTIFKSKENVPNDKDRIEKSTFKGKEFTFHYRQYLYADFSLLKPLLQKNHGEYRKIPEDTRAILDQKFGELVDELDRLITEKKSYASKEVPSGGYAETAKKRKAKAGAWAKTKGEEE